MHKTHGEKHNSAQFFLGIDVYAETISTKHFNFQFAVKLRSCFAFVSRYADAYRAKKAAKKIDERNNRCIEIISLVVFGIQGMYF